MSVADLVPAILSTRMEKRRPLTPTERHMRWLAKNRKKFNAYRRARYARLKAA